MDKTPGSLWVMEISGRIFGFSHWSMLMPQALEGVGSVLLLYAAVKRWFGPPAGLVAGLVLALTPVAALMFRFNNPDALLVLLMTAAAYTMVRAIENGRTKWLMFTGLLLGFAFLAKMLQAFLVVPGFAVAYLWAGPPRLGQRIWQTVLMGAGIIVGAGWWKRLQYIRQYNKSPRTVKREKDGVSDPGNRQGVESDTLQLSSQLRELHGQLAVAKPDRFSGQEGSDVNCRRHIDIYAQMILMWPIIDSSQGVPLGCAPSGCWEQLHSVHAEVFKSRVSELSIPPKWALPAGG